MGLSAAVLILVVLTFVCAPSTARGQVACGQLANGCAAGTCPDLYDAAGNLLGSPTCQQPAGEKCACVFTKADAACTINQQSKKCKGRCEPMYRSAADARAGKNPVKGTCMQVAAGCQCVWKFR
jgi:hypothetical protein